MMADKLTFHLVSPERELFSGEVDQVNIPGADGEFSVLANHAPLMATINAGLLLVNSGNEEKRIFVSGGFADVTSEGLTVLAEQAVPETELKGDVLTRAKQRAQSELEHAITPGEQMAAQRAVDILAAY